MADKDIIDDLKKSQVKPSHEAQDGNKNRQKREDMKDDGFEYKPAMNDLHRRNIEHALENEKKSMHKNKKSNLVNKESDKTDISKKK